MIRKKTTVVISSVNFLLDSEKFNKNKFLKVYPAGAGTGIDTDYDAHDEKPVYI